MSERALYQPKRGNPTALTIVILLHGAAIGALAMSKMEVLPKIDYIETDVFNVFTPPPPPEPVEQVRVELPRTPPVYVPKRVIETPVEQPRVSTTVERPVHYPPVDRGPVIQVEPSPPPPPPPPPPRKLEPARAKADLASYLSDSDYPASAIRAEQQGTTRFQLTVGPDGKVKGCSVVASSGSSALDSATCRLMKSRARFTPARNSDGEVTGDTVTAGIKWVLPD